VAWWKWLVSPAWGTQSEIAAANARGKSINLGPLGFNAPFDTQLYARKRPKQKLQFLSDILNIQGQEKIGEGGKLLGRGISTLDEPLSYYEGLMGSRQEALTAAAPEISTIQGQFDTAAKAVEEFSPRGGGRVQQSAELPFAKRAAIQDVITKQRPEAAKGITDIGKFLSSLGLSEEGFGLEEMNLATEQLAQVLGQGRFDKQMSVEQGKAGGEAAAAIIMRLLEL
jgi:hypothetical protein